MKQSIPLYDTSLSFVFCISFHFFLSLPFCFFCFRFALLVARAAQLLFPDGSYFTGSLDEDDLPHGQGAIFNKDGTERASGEWAKGELFTGSKDELGKRHGEGRLLRLDLSELSGEWNKGVCSSGVIRFHNGDVYDGQISDGCMHGQGKLVYFMDHIVHTGQFTRGKRSGIGHTLLKDGGVWEGERVNGSRHGFGVEFNSKGEIVHCGKWEKHTFKRSCAIPISKLPVGTFLGLDGE
jgi:hypothetical protein